MDKSILYAVIAFLGGVAIATFNTWLTYRTMKKSSAVVAVSFVRSILNVGYLVVVFLLIRNAGFDNLYPLFGAVIGLTVTSIVLSMIFSKKLQRRAEMQKEEGEE